MGKTAIHRWKALFGLLTGVLIAGILLAALWPFRFHPNNDVNWLRVGSGLRFGRHGVVVSQGPVSSEASENASDCSIEILLDPASVEGVSTILFAKRDDRPEYLQLRQYKDGIILLQRSIKPDEGSGVVKRDADTLFRRRKLALLTLTSSLRGTSIYADGRPIERFLNFTLPCRVLGGGLVLGTSPFHIEPWSGEMQGMAIYGRELGRFEVLEHAKLWASDESKPRLVEDRTRALFLFRERSDNQIHNQVPGGTSLVIPTYFELPLKPFLAPPWKEFSWTWDYLDDVIRNILGFIPLGFALCVFLSLMRWRCRAVLITILVCTAMSLGIEVLQAFIPQRESGMTDVVTNTIGGALGAYLSSWLPLKKLVGGMG